jgi:hypothetical protein
MMDVLKGRKKWYDSIGIVASICGIILAGGIGTGVILSLFNSPDSVVITGGASAPAVVLWHEIQYIDLDQPPAPEVTPAPTPAPTPEPLPPEGTLIAYPV